jgi:hypothetical protein
MAVQGKDRFVENNINVLLPGIKQFPPDTLKYGANKTELFCLGKSNKTDLMPVNISSIDLQRAVTFGGIGQYIYSAANGDLYDICLYTTAEQEIYIYGIRTRQLPDKTKTKKAT